MGLGTALDTAISSLRANQSALQITAQNIANANSENYTKRVVVQKTQVVNGVASGVAVAEVRREIDNFLVTSARAQRTNVGEAEARQEFFERVDIFYGSPGAGNSLNVYTDNFFSSLTDLSANAQSASLRNSTLEQSVILSDKIRELASNLEDVRFLADQEIKATINSLNTKVEDIFNINIAIRQAVVSGGDTSSLLDSRDAAINDIAKFLDVNVTFDENGAAFISVPSGEILSPTARTQLTYSQLPSVQSFIDDDVVGAINIAFLDNSGTLTDRSLTLVSASNAATKTDNVTGGRLRGLLDIRDTEIPKMLDQLDRFAVTLQDAFNAIQNDGVGFPPATDLTGTTAVKSTDEQQFSGKIRIAALQADGSPVTGSYGSANLVPLTLDLDALNGGSGAGTARVQDIIDEINQYFGAPSASKVKVGDLDNIKIASTSGTLSSTEATGTMVFAGVQPSATTLARGAFDFSGGAFAVGDTITIGANTFTFKDDGQLSSGLQIELQGSDAGNVAEIISYLNSAAAQANFTDVGKFNFSNSGLTLNLASNTTGTANNGVVLAAVIASDAGNGSPTTPTANGALGTPDTITINGQVYRFIANGSASGSFDNYIELGADLNATIDEIATVLNASTNTSLSTATYVSNGTGTLTITHDQGTAGNAFTLDADFSIGGGGGTIDINAAGAAANPAASALSGGGLATGTFNFDFEFTNTSGSAVTFDITSVAVDNGGAYGGGALPGDFSDYSALAGQRVRTTDGIAIDLSSSTVAIGGVHQISVGVRVTDSDGAISNEVITFDFIVPDTDVDIINDRFNASAISGAADGTIASVANNSRFLTAQLVDTNGNAVAAGDDGFLRIFSNQAGVGFAIDELDSSEDGILSDPDSTATNKGLMHYFGLNDLFASSVGLKNSAITLNVRDAYKADSSLISTGELILSTQPADITADPTYTYEVGAGANQVVTRLADLKFANNDFAASGGLPSLVVSFNGYASEILNFSVLMSNNSTKNSEQQNTLLSAFTDRIENTGGVNLDEELANTIIFQNNYTASAKLVNIVSELLDTLINSF